MVIPSASAFAVPQPHREDILRYICALTFLPLFTIRATGDAALSVPSLAFVVLPVL